jgi:hypothetical protein
MLNKVQKTWSRQTDGQIEGQTESILIISFDEAIKDWYSIPYSFLWQTYSPLHDIRSLCLLLYGGFRHTLGRKQQMCHSANFVRNYVFLCVYIFFKLSKLNALHITFTTSNSIATVYLLQNACITFGTSCLQMLWKEITTNANYLLRIILWYPLRFCQIPTYPKLIFYNSFKTICEL